MSNEVERGVVAKNAKCAKYEHEYETNYTIHSLKEAPRRHILGNDVANVQQMTPQG